MSILGRCRLSRNYKTFGVGIQFEEEADKTNIEEENLLTCQLTYTWIAQRCAFTTVV